MEVPTQVAAQRREQLAVGSPAKTVARASSRSDQKREVQGARRAHGRPVMRVVSVDRANLFLRFLAKCRLGSYISLIQVVASSNDPVLSYYPYATAGYCLRKS